MDDKLASKRDFLTQAGALIASLGMGTSVAATAAPGAVPAKLPFGLDFPATGPMPWFKRVFHLYTGPDGLTRAEQLPVEAPKSVDTAQFLRRTAERVSIGGMAGNGGYDFHVANQPTLLIPIFGSMIVELHDGTAYELVHGDIAIAEDCTGKGHISRAGPQGSFMISVQLPKPGCPTGGSSDMKSFWTDPATPMPDSK